MKSEKAIDRQGVVVKYLMTQGLSEQHLVAEALLLRGFPAWADDQCAWLAEGMHTSDIFVISALGAKVDDNAEGALAITTPADPEAFARSVIYLGEHRGMSGVGPSEHKRISTWADYRAMKWGAKIPVSPQPSLKAARENKWSRSENALDIGVALLVKILPLLRVATSQCCDGHGERPVTVAFHYRWDILWLEAVLKTLREHSLFSTAHSEWKIDDALTITPVDGYLNEETWLALYLDIQTFSRRCMDRSLIDSVGAARDAVMEHLSPSQEPTESDFLISAEAKLHEHLDALI